jgi:hypothetical protein
MGGRTEVPPWWGGILLLNHNSEIRRAGRKLTVPAHAVSTKNEHLLVIDSIPTRGFTAALSVFPFDSAMRGSLWATRLSRSKSRLVESNPELVERVLGTPPPKPSRCKNWLNTIGALLCGLIEMSLLFRSQIVHLSFPLAVIPGKHKTLLTFGKQG